MALITIFPSAAVPATAARKDLKGVKVVLDPGHGGHDPGAVGPRGLTEKSAVLNIAKYLRTYLQAEGAKVIMTRDTDKFIPLEKRADIANRHRAHTFVSIHLNGSPNSGVNYTETYFHKPQAHKTARFVQGHMFRAVNKPNNGIKTGGFAVIRRTNMPGILTEGSFITNPTEEGRLRKSSYRKKMAEGIFKGIAQTHGVIPQKPVKKTAKPVEVKQSQPEPVAEQQIQASEVKPVPRPEGFFERQVKAVFTTLLPRVDEIVPQVASEKDRKIDVQSATMLPFLNTINEVNGVTKMKMPIMASPANEPVRIKNTSNREVRPDIKFYNANGEQVGSIQPVLEKQKEFSFLPENLVEASEFTGSMEITAPETQINAPNTVATVTQ